MSIARHTTTTDDEASSNFLRPTLSTNKMEAPEARTWNVPVIIDAVLGSILDPDILNNFTIYCMMAPAPDSL